MTHICTFPDYSRVPVEIIGHDGTLFKVFWTSEKGLESRVWVPKDWVSLRVHPATLSA